jgi:hypothetical protein
VIPSLVASLATFTEAQTLTQTVLSTKNHQREKPTLEVMYRGKTGCSAILPSYYTCN